MTSLVPMLLLGIVIISTIGSMFGYLLEPGRFAKPDGGKLTANLPGAEPKTQAGDHSSRWAA